MSDGSNAGPLILLVEDNEAIRHAFSILLEEHGYRVAEAASGQEALDAVRARLPDLILMDLGLPDINGLEVTRRLKADDATRDVVVVALTGHAMGDDGEVCRRAGCAGVLSKPVYAAVLLARIPEFLVR